MKIVALLLVSAFSMGACGGPTGETRAGGGPDSPVSSSPDRPAPDDMATIPPTDQCTPGAEVSEDGSGGDALVHERCPANDDYDKKYELVEPRPGMADVRPVPWTGVKTSDDGRTLTVRFWSGVEPCNVLDHVTVVEGAQQVMITLYQGRDPSKGDVACIEIAVLKAVRVELDSPLRNRKVLDGTDA